MTEEEAKQKWCPFARDAESNPAGYTTTNTTAKCIGSECMAWRINRDDWSENMSTGARTYHHGGYCGLAGKP